jgi:hypothetical protein
MTKTLSWKKTISSVSLVLLGGGIALGGNYLVNSPKSMANDRSERNVATTTTPEGAIAVPQNYVSTVVNRVGNTVVRIDADRKVATNVPAAFTSFLVLKCPIFPANKFKRVWVLVLLLVQMV